MTLHRLPADAAAHPARVEAVTAPDAAEEQRTQERILTFIAEYQAAQQRPPTLNEIQAKLGVSRGTVTYHLSRLERAGRLRREARSARGLFLT